MRDIPVNHRYERAYPLGVGYDLDTLKLSGVYDVTDAVSGVAAGSFFIEVIVNAAQSAVDTTVLQRATNKATGAMHFRIFDETNGWAAWAAYAGGGGGTPSAADVTYSGDVAGAANVKAALDALQQQIDALP